MPRQPARLKSAPPEGSAAPGRFFMRLDVGARGSFALSGVIEFAGFSSLSYPVWFNSRRPHHWAYIRADMHGFYYAAIAQRTERMCYAWTGVGSNPTGGYHLAGTPYRFHKAHDGFLHAFSPSPGACSRPLRACTRRRPRKALRLCAFIFCFERW